MKQLPLTNIQFWLDIDCIIYYRSGSLLQFLLEGFFQSYLKRSYTGVGTAAVLTQAMLNCSEQMGTSKTRMGFYKSNSL